MYIYPARDYIGCTFATAGGLLSGSWGGAVVVVVVAFFDNVI